MINRLVQKFPHCRFCLGKRLKLVFNLGNQPAANAFLSKKELNSKEHLFPLKVNFCSDCGLLQLTHVVSPDYLFRNYVYVSSTSPVFVKHFEDYAKQVYENFNLNKNSLIVDIGSNDGILLRPFKKLGVRVLGIDPARKIAKEASKNGLETLPEYFDQKLADYIIKKNSFADVICANNVFAHVPLIDELVLAIRRLLKPEGILVIEAPYLVDFIQKNLFDTIYHEHVSYLSVKPLITFFKRFDMMVFDVQKTNSHGGSIRVFIKKNESKRRVRPSVEKFVKEEKVLGLQSLRTYQRFWKNVTKNKKELRLMLKELKSQGKSIVGYGAPAKGNTLLNYFDIGLDILEYIVDDSQYKQGLYSPGMHLPIVAPSKISETKPDYVLILAWNFADPIMSKLSNFKHRGGKFIIPIPEPKLL
mgnify:CR=1 FL=1